MNFLSLPDIAGMILLMGILDWLRRKYRDSSVDLWMLGLTFILLEAIALAVYRNLPAYTRIAHATALDAYLFAAITFAWAAREDMLPAPISLPMAAPPAAALLLISSLYGLDLLAPRPFLYITATVLALGPVYLIFLLRMPRICRLRLLAIHLAVWGPMTAMAYAGHLRMLVYWGLGCVYLLVAASFRGRVRRGGIGGLVIVTGFVLWAVCFFAHPYVVYRPALNDLVEQVWTMQKFFVILGMLLVLLEDQAKRLADDAMHDALTGLPNRRLFDDRLTQALGRARRTGLSAAVFVVDLDNFKQINDNHGHRMGDLVLARTGQVLKSKVRSSDTLARCGGDEFNVIVNDLTRRADCERIADALRLAVSTVEVPAGDTTVLSASVGYALFPDDAIDETELCELADIRMYKDKRHPDNPILARARVLTS